MKALNGQRRRLDSTDALVAFTSAVIQDAQTGTLNVDVARVTLYGVGIQKTLLELRTTSEIEQRLAALEERLAMSRTARGGTRWTG